MANVTGPTSSTDTAIARWNGTSGTVIEDSTVTVDGSGNLSGVASLAGSVTTTTQSPGDNSTNLATTAYADAAGLQGPVRYVTSAALPNSPTYNNGTAGVGATLTDSGMHVLVVDSENVSAVGSRVLVMNQASDFQNGIYYLSTAGVAGVTPWVLTRSTDYNTPAKINNHDVIVAAGGFQSTFSWIMYTPVTTIGTDPIDFQIIGVPMVIGGGQILVGAASTGVATSVTMSGDVTISDTGETTIKPSVNLTGFPTTTTVSQGNSSTQIASTAYVDTAVSAITAGLDARPSCRVATTAALTATYSNGSSGVGATLTNSGTQAAISIDGVSLAANDRVLVKNQATAAQNGIYTVTTVGSGSTNWVLTRATDFNAASGTGVVEGAFTVIEEGTTLFGTFWIETGAGPFTIGTTAITFTQLQLTNAPTTAHPTYQYLTSGSSATYTTPANCTAIHVEAWGGGGGGNGATTGGGAGGDTIFNSVHAKGGGGGTTGTTGSAGGTGGTGSASYRRAGGNGGNGGTGLFGGAGTNGLGGAGTWESGDAKANSGAGGGGADNAGICEGSGGAGEYFILDITSPAATYTYTIGAAGSAGTGGSPASGKGGSGFIMVTEYY